MGLTLTRQFSNRNVILLSSAGNNKDTESRLRRYTDWLDMTGQHWTRPDLAEYRDLLLDEGLAPTSVSAHLSTVRGRYRELLHNRDLFFNLFPPIPDDLDSTSMAIHLTARVTAVNELVQRLRDAVHPDSAPVDTTTHQDRPDSDYRRLSAAQATRLIQAPGHATLRGIRDTAIIATMLCTGIREGELVALDCEDYNVPFEGEPALYVRHGKGDKARLIPYGELDWCIALIDLWCENAGIESGPLFRSVHQSGRVGTTPLTTRSIQRIVAAYPITVRGEVVTVKPHDLRRTYARRHYEAGMDIVAIRDNLGHASIETTMRYIGHFDVRRRRGKDVYHFANP